MKSFQDIRAKYEESVKSILKTSSIPNDETAEMLIWKMLENAFLIGQDDVLQIIFDDGRRKSLSDMELQQFDIPRNEN